MVDQTYRINAEQERKSRLFKKLMTQCQTSLRCKHRILSSMQEMSSKSSKDQTGSDKIADLNSDTFSFGANELTNAD